MLVVTVLLSVSTTETVPASTFRGVHIPPVRRVGEVLGVGLTGLRRAVTLAIHRDQ